MLSNAVRRKFLRATIGGALALSLTLPAGIVIADELDDRKVDVEKNIDNLEQDMEVLDSDIVATDKKLRAQQAQVPAAEAALADAQSRVSNAQATVADLTNRLISAQATRDKVAKAIEENAAKIAEAENTMAQIASEAYKRGGVSSGLDMILNMDSATAMADGLDMANRAMDSQNAAYNDLAQEKATDESNKLRLVAVEDEISSLKGQAEEALAQEQSARDAAQSAKDELNALVASTESLSAELEAKKPQIQAKLKVQEQESASINQQIKERQERLIKEAAERKRKAEEKARKEAEAERQRVAKEKAAYEAEQERQAAEAKRKQKTYKKKQYVAPKAKPKTETYSEPSSWGLVKPTSSARITSSFGWRPTPAGTIDYSGQGGYVHAGVDWGFGGQCGSPIRAAASGEIWFAGWGGSSGNKVTVSHGVVKGKALATNYHHMSRIAVSNGQHVKQGQVIGYVGTTGNSTGCHLHFETIINGSHVNPLGLL
ncbi:peptidoglycan DD-metalloendopeptidase family protein [Glutamicibacter bergerei]|uniref:peptidoglycan DD-metalloendopeptidase family protein n=1 Tax=Glutamicibacter TaxID=1742989 RepID=UPI000BB69E0A|nr:MULTISPECIES: peptidoglycan DD-metalloendopeptidase family protein [unclassified Glutamicibacter]PCC33842.1 peptidase M23 [Glutamicibacter sp. BW77]HJX77255.1 peptidoglycan DD-metalloendopeptidase family protein [Glutamicibacter sp.]